VTPRRWLITALSFATAITVSLYVIGQSWSEEGAHVSLPLLAHLLALGAAAVEVVSRAIKIQLGAAAMRIPLRFTTALRVCLGGDFGASMTPARSGAEPARFLILNEAGISTPNTLLILFAEIFLEMVTLALVAVVLAASLDGSHAMIGGLLGMVGGYASFVIGVGAIGYMLSRRNAYGRPPGWARRVGLHAGRWRVVQRSLRQLRHSVAGLRRARRGPMMLALVFSVIHVLARLAILPIIVYSIADRSVPLAGIVLWPLAILYGGAVAPAPGGGGLIEVAFKATLGGAIPAASMGAALLWWRFYTFYVNLLAGALVAGGVVMRAIRKSGTGGEEEEQSEEEAVPDRDRLPDAMAADVRA
jgi:uncharacterized protein (TIRG00374 family)